MRHRDVAVRCSVLQLVAVCCSVLQCVAACSSVYGVATISRLSNVAHGSSRDARNTVTVLHVNGSTRVSANVPSVQLQHTLPRVLQCD